MARTRLYLVRHGEQGADGDLSAVGREQAARVGERLRTVSFTGIHHSGKRRAARTAEIVSGYLPGVARHECVADRTPFPSAGRMSTYPERWHGWFDGVPADERDVDAVGLRAAVAHFGVVGDEDRNELLITHNFVVGWFVRHVLDAPEWRWMGLNVGNGAVTVVQWETGRPPVLVSFNEAV
jgi:serine/threonine-protein phosphatase PGAM5